MTTLVRAAQKGDRESAGILYRKVRPLIMDQVRKLGWMDAVHSRDDLEQECSFAFMDALRCYREGKSRFTTYLYACVRRKLYRLNGRLLQNNVQNMDPETADEIASPLNPYSGPEERVDLDTLFEILPENERRALTLLTGRENLPLTPAETAAAMGITERTLRRYVASARLRVKNSI